MLDTMHTHNFDAVRYAWIADYDDAATFLNTFRTGDSENTSQYSNPVTTRRCWRRKPPDVATEANTISRRKNLLAQDIPRHSVYHYNAVLSPSPRPLHSLPFG